jgi:GNAT superfamily N-acetyltransferase
VTADVREAGVEDAGAIASLRAAWVGGSGEALAARMADWMRSEGERRTTWLAWLREEPVGMASMFEYRRMPRPDRRASRWGYVSNMFVREPVRDRGIGAKLLKTVIDAADERGYARIVLSPSARAVPFYLRAGFVVPDEALEDDRLLVRVSPRRSA